MSWLRPLKPFKEDGDLVNSICGYAGNCIVNGAVATVAGLTVAGGIFTVMKSMGYQKPTRLIFEALPLAIAAAGATVVVGVSAIALLILGAAVTALAKR